MEILQNFLSTYGWPRLYGSSRSSVFRSRREVSGRRSYAIVWAAILGQVECASNGFWAARKPTEANGRSKIHGPNEAYEDNDGAYRRARDFRGTPRYAETKRLV